MGAKELISYKTKIVILLAALLVLSLFVSISASVAIAPVQLSANTTSNSNLLSQFEWPEFQGDSSCTRFSAGPAPDTSNVLWKATVSGIQPYISAFDGMIFVSTNTSVVALNGETGSQIWSKDIPMPHTWPIAYKIDDSHMIVEGTCLDPKTGNIVWNSSDFSADTGGIFNLNVYSPEEKMFYTKVGSYVEAWSFSDPSRPPTLAWTSYVRGGGVTGSGITYGEGKVFPGSFENHQVALDAKTGATLWDTPTKGPMIFSGSYYQGRFVRGGTDDNTMYCFNASKGEILWTYTPDTDGYFTVGTATAYGIVYGLNKDGGLYAIDIETGDLTWKYQGPGPLLFPGYPTVADGKVYATTGQAEQYLGLVGASEFACLDAFTGKVIWKLPIEALAPRESVAVAYGHLYLIPGDVTKAVDTISGNEYSTVSEVWAIGSSSIPQSNWPMWRADLVHSSTAQVGPSNLTLTWKFQTGGSVISSPSVADGIVYVGSQDKNIYALGAWSGNLIWKFATQAQIESSVAVANGRVYTGGDDGYVYCLDAYTGELYWKTFVNGDLPFTFGGIVLKSSPAVSNGVVYVGSLDGYMYALNANQGGILWKFKTDGRIESSPTVTDDAVFFTAEEPNAGALYKLDATNGNLVWKKELPYEFQFVGGTDMLGSPSVGGGMVFASSNLGTYYGINEYTGDIVWTFKDPYATEFIVSSPIYLNGQVFIVDKFDIACLNYTNGNMIWSSFTGDELYVSPSYADGKIYVVTSQRHIFVLDALNKGVKIANATTPSSSWSSPTIANGRLYVGCNDWNVYAFANNITYETSPQTSTNTTKPMPTILIAVVLASLIVATLTLAYGVRKRAKKIN